MSDMQTVAARNLRSFIRNATFKNGETDRDAANVCVDVLTENTTPANPAQGVSDEMVEAALNSWFNGEIPISFSGDFRADMRAALTAAIGAGGHAVAEEAPFGWTTDINGKPTPKVIHVGLQDRTSAEVKSGLSEGDVVALPAAQAKTTSQQKPGGGRGRRVGDAVEQCRQTLEDLDARLLQLEAHDARQGGADDARDDGEDKVHRADVLMVRRIEVAAPAGRMAVGVRFGSVVFVGGVSVGHDYRSLPESLVFTSARGRSLTSSSYPPRAAAA